MTDQTGKRDAAAERGGWHLAESPAEAELAGFEFSLERVIQAFYRWKSDCMAAVADVGLSGHDTSVLNVIRMKDRPKGLSEICRLLNREDSSNIQYAIRKLLKAGLIQKTGGASRKGTAYTVTEAGRDATEAYAALRREILLALTGSIEASGENVRQAAHVLDLMTGMYDQASIQAAARR
jgi:predicted MarR family transcription regulator